MGSQYLTNVSPIAGLHREIRYDIDGSWFAGRNAASESLEAEGGGYTMTPSREPVPGTCTIALVQPITEETYVDFDDLRVRDVWVARGQRCMGCVWTVSIAPPSYHSLHSTYPIAMPP